MIKLVTSILFGKWVYIWLKHDHSRIMLLEKILHQLIHQGVFPFVVKKMFHPSKPY